MDHEALYRDHVAALDRWLAESLEIAGRQGVHVDGVLFHSGRPAYYHADDEPVHFRETPHFRRWAPLTGPEHVVMARPGSPPKVIEVRPSDFWLDTTPAPESYWQGVVDHVLVGSYREAIGALGDDIGRLAYVGSSAEAAAQAWIPAALIEPAALMAPLDWFRAYKTAWEVDRIEAACKLAAKGHARAHELHVAGASEHEIHRGYLEAVGSFENEMPYGGIVAHGAKAGILHYQNKRTDSRSPVMLIDAGASVDGYASDITRTWAHGDVHEVFKALLEGMDRLERRLVAQVTAGREYVDIHHATHEGIAELLSRVGIVTASAEAALDNDVTLAFMPHGVGHHLGIQVHDVGGHQAGPEGGKVPPPDRYPALRTNRTLEAGHVVTIEPGLYFIPMMLDPLRDNDDTRNLVDWDLVDALMPYGGIRIEDDVVCTDAEPRDLTRPICPGPNET
ncbi:MAG: Xaa-Pro dipeptidase [Acidobacteriota bacterium]